MSSRTWLARRQSLWVHPMLFTRLFNADRAIQLRSMIEVRKESNSSAIVIFTIVTVVFLPLSFVTSYLGMNSVDIRDGTFHQSLFWAVALPSTACLIFILWIFIRFRKRVRRMWPRLRLERSVRTTAFWLYGRSVRMTAFWLYGTMSGGPQGPTNQLPRDVTLM
jgi:hypothetical protein